MNVYWMTVLVLVAGARCVMAARILAMLPFSGGSHAVFFSSVLKPLAERGHTIVEYSSNPPRQPMQNYTHVNLNYGVIKQFETLQTFNEFCDKSKPRLRPFFDGDVWDVTYVLCEETLRHKAVQDLLYSNESFDLVLTESTFGQESMLVFGHKFRAPTVVLQPFHLWSMLNRYAGNDLSIASSPQFNAVVATDQMTFTERLSNVLSVITTLYYYHHRHLPVHEKFIRDNYREDIPPLSEMLSDVSLYIIPIGGITASSSRKQRLPKDVQQFMDTAKNGVIYFCFGTMVPLHLLPPQTLKIFINVFKSLEERVLWKINKEDIPGLSDNVMVWSQWLPQPEVLAHPNCVLFLTHGGLMSQQEALYFGVPTVGVPFFGDQFFNVKFTEHKGFGVKLDFPSLSESSLHTALTTVLKNPKYKENAVRLSGVFRERLVSPADAVVFWVEHVLIHGGAAHLRPAASRLPWYKLALLDVIGFMLTATLIVLFVSYKTAKLGWKLVFAQKKKSVAKSKNKKTR